MVSLLHRATIKSTHLVASYDFWPVNGAGLLSQEKISKATSEEKRISGEAYDVNKQMIYMAPKSTNESRAQYSPEPAWGIYSGVIKAKVHYASWSETCSLARASEQVSDRFVAVYDKLTTFSGRKTCIGQDSTITTC